MSNATSTQDRFADLNGVQICYREDGSSKAPAVFLIAGLGMQLIEWPEDLVDRLADDFRVIRLDNRDIGLSGRCGGSFSEIPSGFSWTGSSNVPAAYDLGDMAHDVLALADHLEIGQFACIGFSMGGMIAQILATRAPHRVTRFVSLSSTGGDATITADEVSKELMERFFLPFPSEAEAIEAVVESNAHFSMGLMPSQSPQNLQLAKAIVCRAVDDGGYLRQALAITSSPSWSVALTGLTIPALLLHGDRDPCIDGAAAQSLAPRMPQATFKMLAGLGHWLDGETCRYCSDWLRDCSSIKAH
ncbi:alpha/beta fold hydrolase [Pseudooceanicola spongiae]|uniref:Alpha/beta fold hydrolase n=1 Tax=Pseudooceanicola spongiae TaxID=2613965 RepID=A0A7L9WIH8_9RHOB|nr:alpha/beta hydrolase [Pseudooceanicola spongiae]QOL80039.1 alpha/beta fold hydrolase [Pseudooceanicola spongiae]